MVTLFKYHSGNVQLPVELQTLCAILRLFDECLHNVRHAVQRLGTQNIRIYRHFAPAQELQLFLFQNILEGLHCLLVFFLSLREKEHADAIFPLSADLDAGFFRHLGKIGVGNLQQDADAIAGLSLCILTGTVFQRFHNSQCAVYYFPVGLTAHVDNSANAAVLVFKTWIIQAVFCKRFLCSVVIHGHFSFMMDSVSESLNQKRRL